MGLISIILVLMIFHGTKASNYDDRLSLNYYKESCPYTEEIVRREIEITLIREPRTAAQLLRLHFHDCFVMGCDASVLLDSTGEMISEKQAGPNLNSLRGFDVVDKIKSILEEACPNIVSCADLLAIAARDSVELRGGPYWKVKLGRRDSLIASFNGANQFIPKPNSSLETLISNFATQGLDEGDLVALSGSHTIGVSRCVSFKPRIYNGNIDDEYGYCKRNTVFRRILRSICPKSGRDNAVVPLDFVTFTKFDSEYYRNLIQGKGLLNSDNVLISQDEEGRIVRRVWAYALDQQLFFRSFASSMVKMGKINVITGDQGEVRRNCRVKNTL
ncbi:hypothetical protein GIB67_027247 [Kingdonia uniflora]|uniref:Peroxidase n=1 Tax=Kingdonia uniflora TaxID=39325 RepID=A0A7J7KYE1_9MAGN|nr:hypothetical protein GIB67_027247 [Kingdonia uniflora]